MKMRILAFKKLGQKYVKKLRGAIVDSKKMTTFASH